MSFHLLQPVTFAPVAPDEDLPGLFEIGVKQVGPDVEQLVLVAKISFACFSIERCGIAARIEEVDFAVTAREAETLNEAWRRDIEA